MLHHAWVSHLWHSWVHSWSHCHWHSHWLLHPLHLSLLHLHLSLFHSLLLLLLLHQASCLLLSHWVWRSHTRGHHWCWGSHCWSNHWRCHSWHWGSHHWLCHWHTSTHSHPVGHLLLLNHDLVLVSLHHHHLLLLNSLHICHLMHTTSHHSLLMHLLVMHCWVELCSVGSLSSLVSLSILLHLSECSLLGNHLFLTHESSQGAFFSICCSLLNLMVKETKLSRFDGEWVLLVVV